MRVNNIVRPHKVLNFHTKYFFWRIRAQLPKSEQDCDSREPAIIYFRTRAQHRSPHQARVLTPEQFAHLLRVIQDHRYPEKNTALVQISFKLGLRVQEITLLQIKDVAELGPQTSGERSFKLKEILALPAAYTKGADALKRSKSTYQRRRISFSVHDFHQLVRRVETMAKAGAAIKPEDFYPEVKKHRGKSRDLPMNDGSLRTAIENHLAIRLAAHPS